MWFWVVWMLCEIFLLWHRCHLFRKKVIPAPCDEMLIFLPSWRWNAKETACLSHSLLLRSGDCMAVGIVLVTYQLQGRILLKCSCLWAAHGQTCSLAGETGGERYRGSGSIILCFSYQTRVLCQVYMCIALGETMHAHVKKDVTHVSWKLPPDD